MTYMRHWLVLEVYVRYGIGSSSLLSDEKRDKKSETNICLPEIFSKSNENLKFTPNISEYGPFWKTFWNNKYVSKHCGPSEL